MSHKPLFEVCLQTVSGALAAQKAGADRIELCAALTIGGVTPSMGTIERCTEILKIPIMVMIRPRGGDFLYDQHELASMKRDIAICKELGVAGVVFGLLKSDGSIDQEQTKTLVDIAKPLQITFHRAFDVCKDPFLAIEQLIDLGIDRVLTSGQAPTAPEGKETIKKLMTQAGDRITILPGCGLQAENIAQFISYTNAREYHATAFKKEISPMQYRNDAVYMGIPGLAEYERQICSQPEVEAFIRAVSH